MSLGNIIKQLRPEKSWSQVTDEGNAIVKGARYE
jgi:hypothetical protein